MPPYSSSRNTASSSSNARNILRLFHIKPSIEKKLEGKHSKALSLSRILSDMELEMGLKTDIDTLAEKSKPLLDLFEGGDSSTRFHNLSIIFAHLSELRKNDYEKKKIEDRFIRRVVRRACEAATTKLFSIATNGHKKCTYYQVFGTPNDSEVDSEVDMEDDMEDDSEDDSEDDNEDDNDNKCLPSSDDSEDDNDNKCLPSLDDSDTDVY